ncbi:MAG: hypothetical protein JW913_09645 [Chitinispirillaceae bacterium]|nr:hypothetical protein [Chitinispirillaceae bacterium]
MKKRLIVSMVLAVMLTAAAARAQETTAGSADPNEIFNSIMQTMPGEMKARIDSASAVQQSQTAADGTNAPLHGGDNEPAAAVDARRAGLDKLPEAVREQVRKTMKELERENVERMLQFKEVQNRKNVK